MKGEGPIEDGEGPYDPLRARSEKSLGHVSDEHWLRTRKELHGEEIEFLRERSKAPGVAEGGADRNHYCMSCHGVIPLAYDQRQPVERGADERCPHCGAQLEGNVRMMFNWVEMDQPHDSDLRAILPRVLLVVGVVGVLLIWWLVETYGAACARRLAR